jgi:transposase-like protein
MALAHITVSSGRSVELSQRCWIHKTANVIDSMPKSAQPAAKKALQDIYNAEDVRHEALYDRMEVKDLCRQAVAAAGQKLGAA